LILCSFLLLAVPAEAQRTIPAADSVLGYRTLNNLRVWTFTHRAKDMGRLVSFVDGVESINGRTAVRINREFHIDYNLLNEQRTLSVIGQGFVTSSGLYLGDHLEVGTDSVSEQLELEVDGNKVEGYYTRQNREIDQSLAWPKDYFAWDPNLLDQLELFLALHPLTVGASFSDTIFQPQSLLFTAVTGYCDDFQYLELYRGKFDSVFTIHLTSPTPMDLYFTADRRLVRADYLTQQIRAYLDVNSQAQPKTATKPPVTGSRFSVNRLLQYLLFVVIGAIGVFFFNRTFYRYFESYFALIAGAVAFGLTLFTQVPLQEMLLGSAEVSKSLTLTTFLLPSAVAAVIQELLKLIAMALVLRFLRPQPGRSLVVGALVGGIFGVLEACWTIGFAGVSMDYWTIIRNGAMILYDVSAGVLIGLAIERGAGRWLGMLGTLIVIHFCLRFLPALAFTGKLDDPIVSLIVAVVVLVLVSLTLQMSLRAGQKRAR
jgi:hypothetical protein